VAEPLHHMLTPEGKSRSGEAQESGKKTVGRPLDMRMIILYCENDHSHQGFPMPHSEQAPLHPLPDPEHREAGINNIAMPVSDRRIWGSRPEGDLGGIALR